MVGQAENTSAKTSTAWVITVLHEHFHQLQDSQPNFYSDVNALNLARGDQTGMWMLNYAFPYERKEVQEQFAAMSKLLAAAMEAPKRERAKRLRDYLEARQKFQQLLEPDDYKYFSFQVWKEGIARYTEYRVGQIAATKYRVSKEFRELQDYQSFAEVARTTRERIFRQLETKSLAKQNARWSIPLERLKGCCWIRSIPAGGGVTLWRSLICGNCIRKGRPFSEEYLVG